MKNAELQIASDAAREAVERFRLEYVRVWLVDRDEDNEVRLAATASAPSDTVYGGLLQSAVEARITSGRTSPLMLDAAKEDEHFSGPLPAGGFLGLGLRHAGSTIGYVECYAPDKLAFSVADEIEQWMSQRAQAFGAMSLTAKLECSTRGHILLADDDADIRALLEKLLRGKGFTVTAVSNGLLAYEQSRALKPDLVLLDWIMPVIDGRTAAEKLKADELTRSIPIVMLTGQTRIEEKVAALEAGAQDFITKPFDSRELVARLEQQLKWRRLLSDDRTEERIVRHVPERQETEPVACALPGDDFWSLAVQAQQLGRLRDALAYYVQEAERAESCKQFARAALAFRSASGMAARTQNADLANKLMRLSGKMSLCWAETSQDSKAVQDAYVSAARAFLTAGNLKLARKAVNFAETIDSVIADDRPARLV